MEPRARRLPRRQRHDHRCVRERHRRGHGGGEGRPHDVRPLHDGRLPADDLNDPHIDGLRLPALFHVIWLFGVVAQIMCNGPLFRVQKSILHQPCPSLMHMGRISGEASRIMV